MCYVFVKRDGRDFHNKTGKYDVNPGHQGNASVIVCFSITNLQIAGHPGGGGVIKSVISYTQFANKLRMVIASSCSKASLGFMHCGATGITWIKFQASHIVRHHQISASQSAIRYKKDIRRE
jgi:hypothetical protein